MYGIIGSIDGFFLYFVIVYVNDIIVKNNVNYTSTINYACSKLVSKKIGTMRARWDSRSATPDYIEEMLTHFYQQKALCSVRLYRKKTFKKLV